MDDCAVTVDAVKAQDGRVINESLAQQRRHDRAFVHPTWVFGTLIGLGQE